ncbi:hypothetical protein [Rhodanobacter sp. DHG33]|uniref:hypothetical protein n=1 Tax=Rhodanobacter sp. DHG33 TaxID=2775921 RepID=UPI0017808268|nr:hypothetical protein [Rhodanobacter sp. DHG33]MBD8900190.1 hypothetical protein [Rhodanobacter sp. DHG33]
MFGFALLASLPAVAYAHPDIIFSCTTTTGKKVEVHDSGDAVSYRLLDRKGMDELAFSVPRSAASTYQWDGIGKDMIYSVQIPRGDIVYEVFQDADKVSQQVRSGIIVTIHGKTAAQLACKQETVINNMEGVALRPAS